MTKRDFIKISAAVLGTPVLSSIVEDKTIKIIETKNGSAQTKVAIDFKTICFTNPGSRREVPTPADIIRMYKETGILIYRSDLGEPPIFTDDIEVKEINN